MFEINNWAGTEDYFLQLVVQRHGGRHPTIYMADHLDLETILSELSAKSEIPYVITQFIPISEDVYEMMYSSFANTDAILGENH